MNVMISAALDDAQAEALISGLTELAASMSYDTVKQYSVGGAVMITLVPAFDIAAVQVVPAEQEIQHEIAQPEEMPADCELCAEPEQIEMSSPVESVTTCTILSLDSRVALPTYFDVALQNSALRVAHVERAGDFLVFDFCNSTYKYPIQKNNAPVVNPSHTLCENTIMVALRFTGSTESMPYLLDVECYDTSIAVDGPFIVFGSDYCQEVLPNVSEE